MGLPGRQGPACGREAAPLKAQGSPTDLGRLSSCCQPAECQLSTASIPTQATSIALVTELFQQLCYCWSPARGIQPKDSFVGNECNGDWGSSP